MDATLKQEHETQMKKMVKDLRAAYETLRTGRASTHLVENISVEAYGSTMPLIQMATISTPDARTVAIQPFDPSQIGPIERAIQASDVGITPNSDGKIIRLNVPQLTEERRKEMVKLAHKYAEDHRIAIRKVRHDMNDAIKKMEKDGDISEDQMHRDLEEVQKLTDQYIKKVDEEMERKEKEIMEV
ncbi:MAG: ribosome recycling factor [Candidatus Sumerlaeota bacterium]